MTTETQPLYDLLRKLDEEGLENAFRITSARLDAIDKGLPDSGPASDAEIYDSQIAILKPFLAQVWDDAYTAGGDDTEYANGLYELPPLAPKWVYATNPYKDAP